MMRMLLALMLLAASGPLVSQPRSDGAVVPSIAEQLVFADAHLGDAQPPTALHYAFVRRGTLEPALADEVRIDLRADENGRCCAADGHFLSGRHALVLPTIDQARANPVILYFLEHDVRDMQRRTGGQQAHFRRRIRVGLASAARVGDTVVRYAGRDWPATEVRVSPYLDDPYRARFQRFALKEYVFVLARGVPGGVYQLRTRVANPDDPAAVPLVEETVTLAEPPAPSR